MALNEQSKFVPNSAQHDQAVVRHLTLHGRAARRDRAQARLELRSQRTPQAQLLLLDTRPGNARRERTRLNKLVAAARSTRVSPVFCTSCAGAGLF